MQDAEREEDFAAFEQEVSHLISRTKSIRQVYEDTMYGRVWGAMYYRAATNLATYIRNNI